MAKCGPLCEETLRQVERLIDGELDPAVATVVSQHLSACSPCMQHADFRRHLKALVHDKCAERELPAGLDERLRTLLQDVDEEK